MTDAALRSTTKRHRVISACLPCYSKKQKCDHQYPCANCSRRRRPELCVYRHHASRSSAQNATLQTEQQPRSAFDKAETAVGSTHEPTRKSLAETFGYYEGSDANLLGLLKRVTDDAPSPIDTDGELSDNNNIGFVHSVLSQIPPRTILDFLVQYFIEELNWSSQLVHVPVFLVEYKAWWDKEAVSSVHEVEFAILVLRICSFASNFLPSQKHLSDTVRGVSLSDIRKTCARISHQLESFCYEAKPRGSLLRVQHLCFAAATYDCSGHTRLSRDTLHRAIQVAYENGLHGDLSAPDSARMNELEREVRRRLYCNLYIWDRRLARSLDRECFVSNCTLANILPRMSLPFTKDNLSAPDLFLERELEARLLFFWSSLEETGSYSGQCTPYDPVAAEERHEKFCVEFLPGLPSVFAWEPNTEMDQKMPHLTHQRTLLNISLFDSLVHNFKRLLSLRPNQLRGLPSHKAALVFQHRRKLMAAATGLLQSVAFMQSVLCFNQTRCHFIIFHLFQGVATLCSCLITAREHEAGSYQNVSLDSHDLARTAFSHPQSPWQPATKLVDISPTQCSDAIETAMDSLDRLAAGSPSASTAIRHLNQLLRRFNAVQDGEPGKSTWLSIESVDSNSPSVDQVQHNSQGSSQDRNGDVVATAHPASPPAEYGSSFETLDVDSEDAGDALQELLDPASSWEGLERYLRWMPMDFVDSAT